MGEIPAPVQQRSLVAHARAQAKQSPTYWTRRQAELVRLILQRQPAA